MVAYHEGFEAAASQEPVDNPRVFISYAWQERKQLLEAIRHVDLVTPEENWAQKRTDVHEYHVDTFVIGDVWEGKFDFLREEGCEVVCLPRTPEISSTQMKQDLGRAGGATASGRDYTGVDLSK